MHCGSHAPTLIPVVQKRLCHSWAGIDHVGNGNNTELGGKTKIRLTAAQWTILMIPLRLAAMLDSRLVHLILLFSAQRCARNDNATMH